MTCLHANNFTCIISFHSQKNEVTYYEVTCPTSYTAPLRESQVSLPPEIEFWATLHSGHAEFSSDWSCIVSFYVSSLSFLPEDPMFLQLPSSKLRWFTVNIPSKRGPFKSKYIREWENSFSSTLLVKLSSAHLCVCHPPQLASLGTDDSSGCRTNSSAQFCAGGQHLLADQSVCRERKKGRERERKKTKTKKQKRKMTLRTVTQTKDKW